MSLAESDHLEYFKIFIALQALRDHVIKAVARKLRLTSRTDRQYKRERKMILPGGESNPALARSVIMTGACTNPIYYQGLHHVNNASQSEEWAPSSALLTT